MVSVRLFAGTDIGLRGNNEDNFIVCSDVESNEWIVPADCAQAIKIGKLGCVMAVADGMGGQNAGEVASAIAVETVRDMFSPDCLPTNVTATPNAIKNYLKAVVAEADARVKVKSMDDEAEAGMGSTIVIAWVIGSVAYIAWLGDSRAYSYLPGKGIGRISKDHSYVQRLVDAGKMTEEAAMTSQYSNVITRSLGDTSQKAKADVVEHKLEDGEIILLCSDGLCGVCRDEEIGGILDAEADNLQTCKDALIEAALSAGGTDNITVAMLRFYTDSKNKKGKTGSSCSAADKQKVNGLMSLANIVFIIFALCLLFGLGFAGYKCLKGEKEEVTAPVDTEVDDTAGAEPSEEVQTDTTPRGTDSTEYESEDSVPEDGDTDVAKREKVCEEFIKNQKARDSSGTKNIITSISTVKDPLGAIKIGQQDATKNKQTKNN